MDLTPELNPHVMLVGPSDGLKDQPVEPILYYGLTYVLPKAAAMAPGAGLAWLPTPTDVLARLNERHGSLHDTDMEPAADMPNEVIVTLDAKNSSLIVLVRVPFRLKAAEGEQETP